MSVEKCGICNKTTRPDKSHFCQACEKWSHAKCNSIEYKNLRDVWLCKLCRVSIFPFSEDCSGEPTTGIDLRGLKSYFSKLNSLNSFDGFENDDFDEINRINCKYYSVGDFLSIPKRNSLSFFHLNISSLEKHFDEFSALPKLLDHSFDVLGISETRLSSLSSKNIDLPNYSFIHNTSDSSAGGTGLYISNKLTFIPRDDLSLNLFCSKFLESTFCEIKFKNKQNLLVGCIYRHPSMDIEFFNVEFLSPFLNKISRENKLCVLLGDFNINLLNCDSCHPIGEFLDTLGSYRMLPYITLPTRITSQSNTLIDNIFISPTNAQTTSGNLMVGISDHLPQFVFINLKPKSLETKARIMRRTWSSFNAEEFRHDFSNVNWNEILSVDKNDSEASFNSFLNKFNTLFDKHVPLKKLTKNQSKLLNKPWITAGLLTSMKIRDNFLLDLKNTTDPDLKAFLSSLYKLYRNRIVSLLRLSKKNYYNNYFRINNANLRKVWEGVRELTSMKKKTNSSISLQIGQSITSDPLVTSETFNNFFSTVASDIRAKIPPTSHHFSEWLKNSNENSIFLRPTSPNEIKSILQSFKKNKASGPNSIPQRILNVIVDELSLIFSDLINLSFQTGVFPSKLKEAIVIPIYKNKGSPLNVENYRPISLLSNIDKVYQKLMQKRLMDFLDTNNCLYSQQFGFRSNHSTSSALINCTEKIRHALDSGNHVCSVFIDLQKAFDTVDHNILFSKLYFYGIRGVALNWFKSFLTNRSQVVSVSGVKSTSRPILHGVPQGSVLGPLLFLIYVNDLHEAIPFSLTNLFADDTMLLLVSRLLKSLAKKANIDLKCLINWLNANMICLNSKKTELLLLHPSRKFNSFDFKLKINGSRLYPCDSVKYLGIIFDSNFNFEPHISSLCKKLAIANGVLSKTRHYVSREILLTLYFSLFHSHLSYSVNSWAVNINQCKRILNLQKKAVRLITFSEFDAHSLPLFTQLRILSFNDFVKYSNIIFIFNLLNTNLPVPLHKTFDVNYMTQICRFRPRRTKTGILRQPKVSTVRFGNHSLRYQSIVSWNILQNYIKVDNLSELSINRLKYLTKFYFLSSYI